MRAEYALLIEQGPTSLGVYCPDLPGVAAAADTFDEVVALMREAIPAHVAGLIEDGLPVPRPGPVQGRDRLREALADYDDAPEDHILGGIVPMCGGGSC